MKKTKIIILTNRIPRMDYGEDRVLLSIIKLISSKNEILLCIESKTICLQISSDKLTRKKLDEINLSRMKNIILHNDVSIIKYLIKYGKRYSTVALVFFIDTYNPKDFVRSILGWFVGQTVVTFTTFSKYIFNKLKIFGIKKIKYIPLVRIYRPCEQYEVKKKYINNLIKICYVGVVDSERLNPKIVTKFIYNIYNILQKPVELIIVARSDQPLKEFNAYIRPWLKITVLKKFLSTEEKCTLLNDCHIALFTAKKIRFVIPPLFVLEAFHQGTLIYAPYLANILHNEGIKKVFKNIDEIIVELNRMIRS